MVHEQLHFWILTLCTGSEPTVCVEKLGSIAPWSFGHGSSHWDNSCTVIRRKLLQSLPAETTDLGPSLQWHVWNRPQVSQLGARRYATSFLLLSPQPMTDFYTAGDGVFSVRSAHGIDLVDLKTGANRTLVSHADVKDVCLHPGKSSALC